MKKVLFVLALVAVCGVSMAMSNTAVITVDNAKLTIVADTDDNSFVAPEGEKEKEKVKTKEAKTKAAKSEGCAGTKSEAKSEGCAGESKKCASACGGEEKK